MATHLTSMEDLILQLIAYEYSSTDIAKILFISPHTVYTHRANLLLKLDVKNTAGLVRRAIELSILKDRNHIFQHIRFPHSFETRLPELARAFI